MTPEQALWVRLRNLTPVTTITGRIFLEKLPQSVAYPAVLVFLVDDPTTYHLRGPNGGSLARIQVDAMAQERSGYDARMGVQTLAEVIEGDGAGPSATGLSGFRGFVGGDSPGGLKILGCFQRNRMRRYDADELKVLTMILEYQVEYRHVM